ncbi:MAG: hypothetical protein HFE45_01240 [Oscillospiraceae bacterium]|jgi:hypothetical protein|nr:hypothetical protein [Oscillospiraceae bacterium]
MEKRIFFKKIGIFAFVILACGLIVFFCCPQTYTYDGTMVPEGKQPVEAQMVLKMNNFARLIQGRTTGRITIIADGEEYLTTNYGGAKIVRAIMPFYSEWAAYSPQLNRMVFSTLYFDNCFDNVAFISKNYLVFYSSESFYDVVYERYDYAKQ